MTGYCKIKGTAEEKWNQIHQNSETMSEEKFNVIKYLEKGLGNKFNIGLNSENKTLEFKKVGDENWQQADHQFSTKINNILAFEDDDSIISAVHEFLRHGSTAEDIIKENTPLVTENTNISTEQPTSNEQLQNSNDVPIFGFLYTARHLYNMNIESVPYLLEGIFQKYGLVAVTGSSDTGKSSFLRQFAISIVLGLDNFLGYKLNAEHKKVIYVSTEDDLRATSYLVNKQSNGVVDVSRLFHLGFIFDTSEIFKKLMKVLAAAKVDCIIIDALADLYTGNMNQANQVRSYIYKFQKLAIKHDTLIIFLHHTKKGSQNFNPSKDNILGSQGFEAKMRLVLELRKDHQNPELRYLCIVKGNYVPESLKKDAIVLKFDDNLCFTNMDRTVPFSQLAQNPNSRKSKFQKAKDRAIEIKATENLSINEIHAKLRAEGFNVARSTVGNWVQDNDNSEPVGYGYENPEDHIINCGGDDELDAAS